MHLHACNKWLTHWGLMKHIFISKQIIIGSDNGLSPGRPSHFLNQCWDIVNWTLRNKLQRNFKRTSYIFIQGNAFDCVCEIAAILSWPQYVKIPKISTSLSAWVWTQHANSVCFIITVKVLIRTSINFFKVWQQRYCLCYTITQSNQWNIDYSIMLHHQIWL